MILNYPFVIINLYYIQILEFIIFFRHRPLYYYFLKWIHKNFDARLQFFIDFHIIVAFFNYFLINLI